MTVGRQRNRQCRCRKSLWQSLARIFVTAEAQRSFRVQTIEQRRMRGRIQLAQQPVAPTMGRGTPKPLSRLAEYRRRDQPEGFHRHLAHQPVYLLQRYRGEQLVIRAAKAALRE